MSIDTRGRAAAAGVRGAVARDLDPRGRLDELHVHVGGGRRRQVVIALAAVVLVLLATAALVLRAPVETPPPTTHGSPVPISWDLCTRTPPNPCANLTAGTYLVPLSVPVVATLPRGTEYRGDGTASAHLILPDNTHVQVSMDPTTYPRATTATGDGAALARWLAARPTTVGGRVTPVTVSGRPAWQVDMRLADSAPVVVDCYYGMVCDQLLRVGDSTETLGLSHTATPVRWIVVSLPGQRLAVIVIESLPPAHADLAGLVASAGPVVDSMAFTGTG